MTQITLREGDYIDSEQVTSLAKNDRIKIFQALINASGDNLSATKWDELNITGKLGIYGSSMVYEACKQCLREVTVEQILNATNAGGMAEEWTQTGTFQDGDSDYKSADQVIASEFMSNNPKCPKCYESIDKKFEHGNEYTHACGTRFKVFGNGLFIYKPKMTSPTEEAAKPYDGTGLPPVGTVCEYAEDSKSADTATTLRYVYGDKLEVLAYRKVDNNTVLVVFNVRDETACTLIPSCVRPIKTDREKFIDVALDVYHCGKYSEDMAGYLFDAGFKAPEVKV